MYENIIELKFDYYSSKYNFSYYTKPVREFSGDKKKMMTIKDMVGYHASFEDDMHPEFVFDDVKIFIRNTKTNEIIFTDRPDLDMTIRLEMAKAIFEYEESQKITPLKD